MSVTGPQTMDASYCRPAAASRDRRADNRGQIEGGLLWQSAVTSVLRRLELAGVEGLSPRRKLKGLEGQPCLSAHIGAKGLSGGLATRPPDRPPDTENRSPGAVGTATGVEFQGVLLGTIQTHRQPDPNVQSTAALDIERSSFPQRYKSRGRSATATGPLTKSDRANISRWVRSVKELVRAGHRVQHDDHLVRGDDDLAEALVDYSSLASDGWTWPGEKRLAEILNESDRNIRKRVARLRVAELLLVIPPSDGWRSNRYVPVLDGHPLFEVALTSEQVRDAIVTLRWDGDDTGTPVPPQNTVEPGTPVPPEEVRAVHGGRNERSAKSSRNNPQERSSPTPYPAPIASPIGPPWEGGTLDLELHKASSTASPEPAPTPSSTTKRIEQPTPPNGYPRIGEPEVRASDSAEQGAAPVVELSFARLMRDYPHPPGGHGVERRAYFPHARGIWGKLTTEQKRNAVHAAAHAPGREWLGHWLDNGRETGKFEVVEERAVVQRVWVRKDTPQWIAWEDDYGAKGQRPLTTEHRVDGELQTGWMFESEWPPGFGRVGACNE